jgi:hypothetical protein
VTVSPTEPGAVERPAVTFGTTRLRRQGRSKKGPLEKSYIVVSGLARNGEVRMRTEWRGWFVAVVVVAAGCGSSGPAAGPKPEVLISGGCPVGLSADSTSLVWVDKCTSGTGTIRRAPKDQTLTDAGVATLGQGDQAVSVGGVVYSTVMSDLTTASLQRYDDGSGAQTSITSVPAITAFLAADDSNAYLTLGSSPPEVVAQPLAGGAATTLAGNLPGKPHFVAVDGTDVYWVSEIGDQLTTQPTSPTGSLSSTTTDGASVSVLVAGFFRPLGLAVDATNVYVASDQWVDPVTFQPTDGQLLAVSRTTGEVTSLAVTHGSSAVATDGVRVYWTEDQPPAVKAIPVAGGTVVTVWSSSPSHGPNSIALDDTYVYWSLYASDGTGSIVRLAKPSPN